MEYQEYNAPNEPLRSSHWAHHRGNPAWAVAVAVHRSQRPVPTENQVNRVKRLLANEFVQSLIFLAIVLVMLWLY